MERGVRGEGWTVIQSSRVKAVYLCWVIFFGLQESIGTTNIHGEDQKFFDLGCGSENRKSKHVFHYLYSPSSSLSAIITSNLLTHPGLCNAQPRSSHHHCISGTSLQRASPSHRSQSQVSHDPLPPRKHHPRNGTRSQKGRNRRNQKLPRRSVPKHLATHKRKCPKD